VSSLLSVFNFLIPEALFPYVSSTAQAFLSLPFFFDVTSTFCLPKDMVLPPGAFIMMTFCPPHFHYEHGFLLHRFWRPPPRQFTEQLIPHYLQQEIVFPPPPHSFDNPDRSAVPNHGRPTTLLLSLFSQHRGVFFYGGCISPPLGREFSAYAIPLFSVQAYVFAVRLD